MVGFLAMVMVMVILGTDRADEDDGWMFVFGVCSSDGNKCHGVEILSLSIAT